MRMLFYKFIILTILFCTACPGNPALNGPQGIWVMDRGDKEKIGILAFRVRDAAGSYTFTMGIMEDGIFVPQSETVRLIPGTNYYTATPEGFNIQLEPDATGFIFRGFGGDSHQIYHFRRNP